MFTIFRSTLDYPPVTRSGAGHGKPIALLRRYNRFWKLHQGYLDLPVSFEFRRLSTTLMHVSQLS